MQGQLTDPEKTVPVSVTLIVKNCADSLRKCLGSVLRHFLREGDELIIADTGSTDDTIKVARGFGAKVIDAAHLKKDVRPLVQKWLPEHLEAFEKEPQFSGGFILDFAEARQFVTDAAKHNIVFWLDADDELSEKNSGELRNIVDRTFLQDKADSIFLRYEYTFDRDDGRLTTTLKRERVFDRRKYQWKGRCHESALPIENKARTAAYFQDLQSVIVHTEYRKPHLISDIRNYCIMRKELEESSNIDPRTLFYCANAARGLQRFSEAVEMYTKFSTMTGSRDDRYSAAYYTALTYVHNTIRRPLDSLDWFFKCVKLKPEDPRGYFGLARAYFLLKRHNESLHWFRVGQMLPEPEWSLHSYDPEQIHSLPWQIAVLAAKELDDENMAFQLLYELKQRRPNHPDTQALEEAVRSWKAGKVLIQSCFATALNCKSVKPGDEKALRRHVRQTVATLRSVPVELERQGLGALEPKTNCDVTIFCGATAEPWGPKSAGTGIGGSEKMVIELARQLQAKGKSVVVYCECPADQRGVDAETGVLWRHYGEIDMEQPRKSVVFWRAPAALELPLPREKSVVWLHDVQNPRDWTPARIAAADVVVVQSEFHASTLGPEVRKALGDKLLILRNGVNIQRPAGVAPRDRNKVIYASSPDRGLLTAIEIFKKAKQKNPDLRLHVYYGFNETYLARAAQYEYQRIPDLNQDASMYEYMQCVMQTIDHDDDIIWHGRVGFDKMAEEFESAGVWLYPTRFDEISCMAAMEAQCAGCYVLASEHAALKETIDWKNPATCKVSLDNLNEAADCLVILSQGDYDRVGLAEDAKKRFDMEALANEWLLKVV